MKNSIEITTAQLVTMLLDWNLGAQPATIQYSTNPKIKKEGKTLFGDILKLGAVNCMIDFNYEKAVNRRLKKEGKESNFEVQPLWKGKGEHINRRLVKHVDTGAMYLSYKFQRSLKAIHFDSVLNFIPTSLLQPYFYAKSKPKNQGVNDGSEIIIRTLKIENIRRLKMKGLTYVIVN